MAPSSDSGALPELMNPGEMALTVMPLDTSSLVSERVSSKRFYKWGARSFGALPISGLSVHMKGRFL
jgi:hypothetical protein